MGRGVQKNPAGVSSRVFALMCDLIPKLCWEGGNPGFAGRGFPLHQVLPIQDSSLVRREGMFLVMKVQLVIFGVR